MGGLTITINDLATGRQVYAGTFERFPVRIGRHEENEVALTTFSFVSRWHAEVRADPHGAISLVALAAGNPLKIANQSLASGAALPIEGRLTATLSTLELIFACSRAPARPATPASASTSSPPDSVDPDLPRIHLPTPKGPSLARPAPDPGGPPVVRTDDHHLARRARLQAAVAALRPLHHTFNAARRAWEDACVRTLQELGRAADHAPDDARLVFREFPAADRPSLARDDAGPRVGVGELGVVGQVASELLPGLRPPADEPDVRRFLARAVDILRVFAACTIELQRMRDRQCSALGITWEQHPDPLTGCETREDLLRYLLDWRDPGEARSEELVRAFAGLVDHIQAYLQASLQSARQVVFSLSPAEMERSVATTWPTRTAALWRHYESAFAALYGDTYDNLKPAFHAALARAYGQALARLGVSFQLREPGGPP